MNATERFSKTVDYYIRFRPGYPDELLSFLQNQLGVNANTAFADIGSGTGKLTELLVKNGSPVFAVEPNLEMREAAEVLLKDFSNFHSIDGTAENTRLPDQSVQIITAAQAFHWFDPPKARAEFLRIAQPESWVLLIWNKRLDDHTPFMKAYNDFLLQFSTDYEKVNLRRVDDQILSPFFGPGGYALATFDYAQHFDLTGLEGRYLSCSYAFDATHPDHDEAMTALKILFEKYAETQTLSMWYQTEVYFGRLS